MGPGSALQRPGVQYQLLSYKKTSKIYSEDLFFKDPSPTICHVSRIY